MQTITLPMVLSFGNLILSSANVIIGFSLLIYIAAHNPSSPVARAYCALITFVSMIYLADVSLAEVSSVESAYTWLRFQWIGISFIPAAYMHFGVAVLRTTGDTQRWRHALVWLGYAIGTLTILVTLTTDWLVNGATQTNGFYHLVAGRYFVLFALYYISVLVMAWLHIAYARMRCVTTTSRRRMSYLLLAFAVPSLGVFPYLLFPTTAHSFSATSIEFLALLGNLGTAAVTVLIGYIVAYQGVLSPDRVIKHDMLHFLLRGPVVAILVIVIMLVVPRVDIILGLPREMVLIVAVAAAIVSFQLLANLFKPAFDRLIYYRDRNEIELIQTMERRLLTSTDLSQLLENSLISLCDLLRVPDGFIATITDSELQLRVYSGQRSHAAQFLDRLDLPHLVNELCSSRPEGLVENSDFRAADGYWVLPLQSSESRVELGLLAIRADGPQAHFEPEQLDSAYSLVRRTELALEDKALQEQIFGVLRSLEAELNLVQGWRSITAYSSSDGQVLTSSTVDAGFGQSVKDALVQLWGGPKLSHSPLSSMEIVRARLSEFGNIPTRAIRAILQEAIERLRPDGQRSMTSNEWMLYNILELRFIQGQRIRHIAQRLAMSESDFYRKQRIAIDQVAETLLQMERNALEGEHRD
ncbi:MAG: hypothetical protein GXY52_10115 [Chloroflexi bacterium]|nr:hypothetical protein [Chloroflexota bacterium]